MIWLHGEEELSNFLAKLNSFHESIKFTWEIGLQEIAFLRPHTIVPRSFSLGNWRVRLVELIRNPLKIYIL